MVRFYCGLHTVQSHLGRESPWELPRVVGWLVGMSVWDFLHWVNWDSKTHLEYGLHHFLSWALNQTKGTEPAESQHVNSLLQFLQPCIPHNDRQ